MNMMFPGALKGMGDDIFDMNNSFSNLMGLSLNRRIK